jgi:hypothetical protein
MKNKIRIIQRHLLCTLLALAVLTALVPVSSTYVFAGDYPVYVTQNGNSFKVRSSLSSKYVVHSIIVDADEISRPNKSSFESSFNLTDYTTTSGKKCSAGTGYHTVYIMIWDNKGKEVERKKTFVAVNRITRRPDDKGKFRVYSSYFNYFPYINNKNTSGELYMELSTNGKDWPAKNRWKLREYNLGSRISGLKPGKKYYTRIRYGQLVTYKTDFGGNGKTYFFGGPVLKTATVKTGKAKIPSVRSIKVKAVKVKKHKVKHPEGYYWQNNQLVYKSAWTEKYYTYKVKVTVRLKKKPGTRGLWVNGRYLKGNKKKYTATFKPSQNRSAKKPKGRVKYTVRISSGQSASYGGYSPEYRKKRTVK